MQSTKVHLGIEGPTLRAIKMAPGRGGFQVGGWPWNPNRKLLDLDSDIPGSLSIATVRSYSGISNCEKNIEGNEQILNINMLVAMAVVVGLDNVTRVPSKSPPMSFMS